MTAGTGLGGRRCRGAGLTRSPRLARRGLRPCGWCAHCIILWS
ncbi:hypothetical protein BTZ20_2090 [Rhodococcus sp. MTM3W5.2]|nr:hypothetical protein BTZ20_2090 [Rhodococcus sp. MTM3W5.2]